MPFCPGIVRCSDDRRDGLECGSTPLQERKKSSSSQCLGDGEKKSRFARDGPFSYGAVLGARHLSVDWRIDEVVPGVRRVGKEEAAAEEQSTYSYGLKGRGVLIKPSCGVQNPEKVGEIDQKESRWGAEARELDEGSP